MPHIKKMLDTILEKGTNEDGLMFDRLGVEGGLSDGWGYNYVSYLCYDMVARKPVYREHLRQTLGNLSKPKYKNYKWEGTSIDGYADSIEGAIYLLNRLPVSQGLAWVDQEMAANVTRVQEPLGTTPLWSTYKLDANGVRTVLQHALMHTRGAFVRPWRQDLELGASQTKDGLAVTLGIQCMRMGLSPRADPRFLQAEGNHEKHLHHRFGLCFAARHRSLRQRR